MANELVKKETNNVVSYTTSDGTQVTLNNAIVRALTNNNDKITNDEIMLFVEMCKAQKLNPLIKESYLVKYDNTKPAQQITAVSAFLRIADENAQYDGFENGIIVSKKTGENYEQHEKEGTLVYGNEILIGGWAKIYRKDRKIPITVKLNLKEYSKGQATWQQMPATMIAKCALVGALRKAFPKALGGLYTDGEIFEETKTPDFTPSVPVDISFEEEMPTKVESVNPIQETNIEETYEDNWTDEDIEQAMKDLESQEQVVEEKPKEKTTQKPKEKVAPKEEREIKEFLYPVWKNEVSKTGEYELIEHSYDPNTKKVKAYKINK